MRIKSTNIRIAFWVLLGLVLSFTSLALNRPVPLAQVASATPTLQVDAATTEVVVEGVGSTDGIMLMAVVIVLIVIIPILLKRQVWSNGKENK